MAKGKKAGNPHDTGGGKTETKPSATGVVQPVTNPLDLWYLCEKINYALAHPVIDKDGSRQYQRVVTRLIRFDDDAFKYHFPYIGECGYDMTESPPQPIMSLRETWRPSRLPLSKYVGIKEKYIYKMYGLSTADIRFEVIRFLMNLSELERILTPAMRKQSSSMKEIDPVEDIFKIRKGLIRIPDVIKLKNISLSGAEAFRQNNIDDIIEIKFNETNDSLSREQQWAYEVISGRADNLHLLESHTCQIDDRRRRRWLREAKKEPLYVPVSNSMERRQQRVRLEIEEYQHLVGEIDGELEKVNFQLSPILAGELCERVMPKYDTPYKLEAPMSAEDRMHMERARTQIEIALSVPMVAASIVAIGVSAGAGGMVLPAVVAGPGESAVVATTSGAISVGGKVVEFSAISKQAAQAAVAASSAITFELAAKDMPGKTYSKEMTRHFLSDRAEQQQEYIYWDD